MCVCVGDGVGFSVRTVLGLACSAFGNWRTCAGADKESAAWCFDNVPGGLLTLTDLHQKSHPM